MGRSRARRAIRSRSLLANRSPRGLHTDETLRFAIEADHPAAAQEVDLTTEQLGGGARRIGPLSRVDLRPKRLTWTVAPEIYNVVFSVPEWLGLARRAVPLRTRLDDDRCC